MFRTTARRTTPLALSIALVLALLVAACGATPTATPVPPTATPVPPTATKAPATAAPSAPTATKAPAAPPTAAPTATKAPVAAGVTFANDIKPLFDKNCTRCHGGSNPRAGLSLGSYETALKGGNNPPAVVPGDPDKSPLYTLVKNGVMPFGGPKLAEADAQKIYDWIKAGAANN